MGALFPIIKIRNPLTWEGSPSFMVAMSRLLRSLAQSQLPCASCVFPHLPPHSPPARRAFTFTYKETLTSPILLSATLTIKMMLYLIIIPDVKRTSELWAQEFFGPSKVSSDLRERRQGS
jgi:hypothetical protein